MRSRTFLCSFGLLGAILAAGSAQAQIGNILRVTTAADTVAFDGACSLREAILAANLNRNGDFTATECIGLGIDSIRLSTGLVINLASNLPAITEQVTIAGPTGRAVIYGTGFHIPPSSVGLQVASTAGSTTLRNLVLQNFDTAVLVQGASTVIIGNYIGTDATGTAGASNGIGIQVAASGARIGGTTGVTPGGACTGDCNLIAGNSTGVLVSSATGTLIQGNHFGANAAGTAAIGGHTGLRLTGTAQGFTIGGTTVGAGNLVAGHLFGISLDLTPVPFAANSYVEGNRIGTNTTGTAALANTTGLLISLNNTVFPLMIGGAAAGAGNLVSGNAVGIRVVQSNNVVIQGNRIGTQADGVSALPNTSASVELGSSAIRNLVGGVGAGEGNVIAHNGTGVRVLAGNVSNAIRGNSIHSHPGKGIQLDDLQSNTAFAPVITSIGFGFVSGTGCAGCTIDVYSDDAEEGRKYEGTAVAIPQGNWSVRFAAGPNVTATATNSDNATSEFSAPLALVDPDVDDDGVIDDIDNCVYVANPSQLDTDADGYGNFCDGDLNQTGLVTASDFALLRNLLNQTAGSSPLAAAADMNGSGMVTVADYQLLRASLGGPPGPSGFFP